MKNRHVNASACNGSESRVKHNSGQGAALQQGSRRSSWAEAATVDNHIDIDVGQAIERLSEVLPHSTKMARTAWLAKAWQEQPTDVLLVRERQRLIKDDFAKWATITVCLCYT